MVPVLDSISQNRSVFLTEYIKVQLSEYMSNLHHLLLSEEAEMLQFLTGAPLMVKSVAVSSITYESLNKG